MMDDIKASLPIEEISSSGKYRVMFFVSSAILISMLLVSFSMYIYNISGAELLDLSRPGYINARSGASDSSDDFKTFSSTGAIDQSTVDDFKDLYNRQTSKIKSADAFGSDPLNPEALGVNSDTGEIPE